MNEFAQDLFWKNMPFKKHINKIGFTKHYWSCAKIGKNYPTFLYTGQSSIEFNKRLSEKQLKALENIDILEIYLSEPITYYNENHPKPNINIAVQTREEDLPFVRILELEELVKFKIEKNIRELRVYTCDYNINKYFKKKYSELKLFCYDTFLAATFNPPAIQKKNIKKKFFCPNARFDTHRHLIMSWLADKPGYYTWYYKTHYNIENNYWSDQLVLPWDVLKKGADLLNRQTFKENEDVPIIDVYNPYKFYNPFFSRSVVDLYKKNIQRSFCCIINETRFAQHTANFSEKTTFPISYGTPFILVAPPETLKYLKEFGFKTFDAWWDESYDTIRDHSLRMKKILNLIDDINNLSYKELNEMYRDMKPILEHNAHQVIKLRNCFDQYVFKN